MLAAVWDHCPSAPGRRGSRSACWQRPHRLSSPPRRPQPLQHAPGSGTAREGWATTQAMVGCVPSTFAASMYSPWSAARRLPGLPAWVPAGGGLMPHPPARCRRHYTCDLSVVIAPHLGGLLAGLQVHKRAVERRAPLEVCTKPRTLRPALTQQVMSCIMHREQRTGTCRCRPPPSCRRRRHELAARSTPCRPVSTR